jgi:hypothetical protein
MLGFSRKFCAKRVATTWQQPPSLCHAMIKTWLLDKKKRRAVAGRFGVIWLICEKKFGLVQ